MLKNIVIVVLIIVSVIAAQNKNIFVSLNIKTILTNENKYSKKYLFVYPKIVKTDSKNNFYLVDKIGCEIRKYSSSGKYILSFGSTGKGPGEFQEVSDIVIDENDNIIVYDAMSGRITIYNKEGKLLDTINELKKQKIDSIINYNNEYYLTKVFLDYKSDSMGNKYFLYKKDFKHKITDFGYAPIFWDYKNDITAEEQETGISLNEVVLQNGNVFAVKKVYDGKLFKFDSKNNWALSIFKSNNENIKTFSVVKKSEPIEKEKNINTLYYYYKKTKTFIKMHIRTASLGLYIYRNKYIINFITVEDKNYITKFGIEIFKLDGGYLGYYELDKQYITSWSSFSPIFCMNKDGEFFTIGINNSKERTIVLKKCKINILER